MTKQEIKIKIEALAKQYHQADEEELGFEIIYLYEREALNNIVQYCECLGYLINGFPTQKKLIISEDEQVEYFTDERFQFYLDCLVIEKEDIADLMWNYISKFWPDYFESKEGYIETINFQLNSSNFYDVNLE